MQFSDKENAANLWLNGQVLQAKAFRDDITVYTDYDVERMLKLIINKQEASDNDQLNK